MSKVEDWISTQKVEQFDFVFPTVESIHITDIAGALSKICRFGGHSNIFYSVAEHSIIVAEVLERGGANKATVFAGLMHDCSEAYLGDMPRPIRELLKQYESVDCSYRDLHLMLEECILISKYNLSQFTGEDAVDWAKIKDIDGRLCVTEAHQLGLWNHKWQNRGDVLHITLHRWNPDEAYQLFMMNFAELTDALFGYNSSYSNLYRSVKNEVAP